MRILELFDNSTNGEKRLRVIYLPEYIWLKNPLSNVDVKKREASKDDDDDIIDKKDRLHRDLTQLGTFQKQDAGRVIVAHNLFDVAMERIRPQLQPGLIDDEEEDEELISLLNTLNIRD